MLRTGLRRSTRLRRPRPPLTPSRPRRAACTRSRWRRPSTRVSARRCSATRRCCSWARTSAPLGGVFRVTEGLSAEFGEKRVLDTPLAESGIVGTAIGLAMRGYRPVSRSSSTGSSSPRSTRSPRSSPSLTVRHDGALSHADRHPRAVRRAHRLDRAPPGEPRGVLRAHPGPAGGQPLEPARRVLDDPGGDRLERPGAVLRAQEPLLAQGPRRPRPLGAAAAREPRRARRAPMSRSSGTARWSRRCCRPPTSRPRRARASRSSTCARSPPSTTARCSSRCRSTGRLVVAQEAYGNVSVGSEIAATVAERAFYSLEAPVLRVSGFDTPVPARRARDRVPAEPRPGARGRRPRAGLLTCRSRHNSTARVEDRHERDPIPPSRRR